MTIALILQMAADAEPQSIGEAELRTLIKNRRRSSRVPERVVLDALPYNEMGERLRREVRKLFQA